MKEQRPVTWPVVMPAADLWELAGAKLGGKKIVLLNVQGEIRAFEYRCPRGSRLSCVADLLTTGLASAL